MLSWIVEDENSCWSHDVWSCITVSAFLFQITLLYLVSTDHKDDSNNKNYNNTIDMYWLWDLWLMHMDTQKMVHVGSLSNIFP